MEIAEIALRLVGTNISPAYSLKGIELLIEERDHFRKLYEKEEKLNKLSRESLSSYLKEVRRMKKTMMETSGLGGEVISSSAPV